MPTQDRQSNLEDRKLTGERRKSLRYAYLTSIATSLGSMCMLANPLQLFVIKLGASELYLGFLSFFVAYAGFFMILSMSKLETVSKKKIMLTGWLSTAVIMLPLAFIAVWAKKLPSQHNVILWVVLILIALRGIFDGYGSSAWFPILQDNVPARITGKFFARLRLVWQSFLLVFVWGISAFLGKDSDFTKFALIFAFGTICLFIRPLASHKMAELPPQPSRSRRNIFSKIRELLKQPALRVYLVYIMAIHIALVMPIPFQIKMLKNLDYGDGYIMLATSMVQLASILTLRFWGKISDRYGNRAVFSVCVIGNMISILLWLLIDDSGFSRIFVFVLYYLWGMFTAGNGIAQTRHMMHTTPKGNQASLVLINIVTSISLAIAPLAGGIILALTKDVVISSGAITLNNYQLLYLLCAILFIIPYNLRKKLRITKENSTNYVMSAVLRPIRQSIASHLRVLPDNLSGKPDNKPK